MKENDKEVRTDFFTELKVLTYTQITTTCDKIKQTKHLYSSLINGFGIWKGQGYG